MTTEDGDTGSTTPEPEGEVVDLGVAGPAAAGGPARSGARIVAVLLAGALVGLGLVFALTQSGSSGSSAEEAVRDLFAAIEDEDVLGALATLDVGERDALSEPVRRLSDQLERLEVLGPDFDLERIGGIDLSFAGLTFRTEPVRDDLARVYVTGGTATFSYDTDQLPLGAWTEELLDGWEVEFRGQQGSEQSDLTGDGTSDDFLVAHRGPDGWRVSIGYTTAEMARSSMASGPAPAQGSGLAPAGADTPEAAVEELIRAVARFDAAGAVARLSPLEFGALQDYWNLLVPGGAVPDADEIGFTIEIEAIDASSTVSGDRGTVMVSGVDAVLTRVGEDGFTLEVSVHDGCVEVRGDIESLGGFGLDPAMFADGPVCSDDLEELFGPESGSADPGLFDGIAPVDVGITVHRVEGAWFVAPVSTVLDAMATAAEAMDDATVDAIAEFFESFTMGFSSEMIGTEVAPFGMEGMDGMGEGDWEEFDFDEPEQPSTTITE